MLSYAPEMLNILCKACVHRGLLIKRKGHCVDYSAFSVIGCKLSQGHFGIVLLYHSNCLYAPLGRDCAIKLHTLSMYQIAHLVNIWAVMDEQNAVLLAKLYSTLEEIVVRCCGCRVVRVVEQQRLAPGDRTQV